MGSISNIDFRFSGEGEQLAITAACALFGMAYRSYLSPVVIFQACHSNSNLKRTNILFFRKGGLNENTSAANTNNESADRAHDSATRAKIEQQPAELQISQPAAELHIVTTEGQLQIDQTQLRADLGSFTFIELARKAAQKEKKIFYKELLVVQEKAGNLVILEKVKMR